MDRVVVTAPMVGICFMQVCVAKDATDEEILEVCNRENRSGTMNGWGTVFRSDTEWLGKPLKYAPVKCEDDSGRLHIMVGC